MMKTLKIYTPSTFITYINLHQYHLYEIDDKNNLIVWERNDYTGEENLVATFRNWDYFTIE